MRVTTKGEGKGGGSVGEMHRVLGITIDSSEGENGSVLCLRRVRFKHQKIAYFLVFSGIGSIVPFIPLYLVSASVGLSPYQLGVLFFLATSVSSVCAPLWGMIIDRLRTQKRKRGGRSCLLRSIYRSVLVGSILIAAFLRWSLQFFRTFDTLVVVSIFASFFMSPVVPTLDELVMYTLTESKQYGGQRVWGAIGYGVATLIVAIAIEATSNDVDVAMWACAIVMALAAVEMATAPFVEMAGAISEYPVEESGGVDTRRNVSCLRGMCRILCSKSTRVEFWIIMLIVLVSGILTGIIESFLFVYLRHELNASYIIMGLSRAVMAVAETPAYFYSSRVLDCFGIRGTLAVSMIAYVLRFVAYSTMVHPWMVLPIESIHMLTYGCMWCSSIAYAHHVAPSGLGITMQRMFEVVHGGLGVSLGALIGGALYGETDMFGVAAGFAGFGLALLALYNWKSLYSCLCCCCRARREKKSYRALGRLQSDVSVSSQTQMFALEADLGNIAAEGVMMALSEDESEKRSADDHNIVDGDGSVEVSLESTPSGRGGFRARLNQVLSAASRTGDDRHEYASVSMISVADEDEDIESEDEIRDKPRVNVAASSAQDQKSSAAEDASFETKQSRTVSDDNNDRGVADRSLSPPPPPPESQSASTTRLSSPSIDTKQSMKLSIDTKGETTPSVAVSIGQHEPSSPTSAELMRRKHRNSLEKQARQDQEESSSYDDLPHNDRSGDAVEGNQSLSHKERLVAFYKKHNPTRLFNVDYLLQKYKGREEVLFADLQAKYTVTRTTATGNFTLGGAMGESQPDIVERGVTNAISSIGGALGKWTSTAKRDGAATSNRADEEPSSSRLPQTVSDLFAIGDDSEDEGDANEARI